MDLWIISGLSGAGKSKAASFLEDMGCYIVDNMPAAMMLKFAEFCAGMNGRYNRVALVYDVRTAEVDAPEELFAVLDQLEQMEGFSCQLLFLEASPETIVNRYKETRRRHPLGGPSLEEAVRRERSLMAPVRARAQLVIDTSTLSTAQLRAELLRLCSQEDGQSGMSVNVTSFGFKYGLPMEADLVIDVRFLPNPFYVDALRRKTGLDRAVHDYIFQFQQTRTYLEKLKDLLTFSLPLYVEEGKSTLTLAVGCTGGHHRSVAVAHALAAFVQNEGYPVLENHRDIQREG